MISNFLGTEIVSVNTEIQTVLLSGENWKLYSTLFANRHHSECTITVAFVRLEKVSGRVVPIDIFSVTWEAKESNTGVLTYIYRPTTSIGLKKSKRATTNTIISNEQYIERLTEEEFVSVKKNWRNMASYNVSTGIGSLILMPILPVEVKEWIVMSGLGGPDLIEFSKILIDKVKSVISKET